MTRRAKLSRAERERRAAKREQRAATADERAAKKRARSFAAIEAERRKKAIASFEEARESYDLAVAGLLDPEPDRVVCDLCGLEQAHIRAGWDPDEYEASGFEVAISRCRGFEGIGCGSETAITIERYREETEEPLVYVYGP